MGLLERRSTVWHFKRPTQTRFLICTSWIFIIVGGDTETRRKRKSLDCESRRPSWKKRCPEEKMVIMYYCNANMSVTAPYSATERKVSTCIPVYFLAFCDAKSIYQMSLRKSLNMATIY